MFNTLFIICGIYAISSANSVPAKQTECAQVCSMQYNPLCATNGKVYKEFGNTCLLEAANCHLENLSLQKYIPTAMEWCSTEFVGDLQQLLEKLDTLDLDTPDCVQPCPLIYSPVCVSNGQYRAVISNPCLMEAINCVLRKKTEALFRVMKYDSC